MSETLPEGSAEGEIRYVLGNQEFVLSQDVNSEVQDYVCPDGSRAILVDGQYYLTDDSAILYQEEGPDLQQYYINEVNAVAETEETALDETTSFETTQILQFVSEDTNDEGQIIYYTDGDSNLEEFNSTQEEPLPTTLTGIQDEDGNIYSFKRIKLEGEVLDYDDFIEQEPNDLETPVHELPEELELSQITGRNLITGQTVTLHSYMEKLQMRFKNHKTANIKTVNKLYEDNVKKPQFNHLLDKKFAIGKTKTGKQIVAKVIHVEQKPSEVVCDQKVEVSLSADSLEEVSKTLGGVMEMESVRKRLESKNIVVKLCEKKFCEDTEKFVKSTNYCYGYMEKETVEEDEAIAERWKFVSDQNRNLDDSSGDESEKKTAKFPITTSLTIQITYTKGGDKTIKVNLNPSPANMCTTCSQYFKSQLQLRLHMTNVHNTTAPNHICEICGKSFEDLDQLEEHRTSHVEEGIKQYTCSLCHKYFLNQYDMNFHKKSHFSEKHFACNVCLRTFSRHSNLLRHIAIHKGAGALFKCEICSCSYNYASSLTKHMVQNHINGGDCRKKV